MQTFAECHGSMLLGRRGTVLASQAFGDYGSKARQAFLDMVPAWRPLAAGSGARRRRPERRARSVFVRKTPDNSDEEILPEYDMEYCCVTASFMTLHEQCIRPAPSMT
jgi:hypothetical protein